MHVAADIATADGGVRLKIFDGAFENPNLDDAFEFVAALFDAVDVDVATSDVEIGAGKDTAVDGNAIGHLFNPLGN